MINLGIFILDVFNVFSVLNGVVHEITDYFPNIFYFLRHKCSKLQALQPN